MQNKKKKIVTTSLRTRLSLFALTGVMIFSGISIGIRRVSAATATCNSISECNAQIDSNNNAVANLQNQAVSYQDAVSRLNSQIYILQGQISSSIQQQASLSAEIIAKQAEIEHQKQVLGDLIRAMYVDNQMSTIEQLATSKNLSDYVDKQEYRNVVQKKIQTSLKEIAAMQVQLQAQKVQVEALLAQQNQQQQELSSARAQQSNLLAYNQSQQASYNAQTSANKQKVADLIEAQRRANSSSNTAAYYFIRFPGAVASINGNDYPYANSGFSMSTAPGCNDGDGPDQWGYCTRQCVSYTAWAVSASGRSAPYFYGNAKDWVYQARIHGIPVYTSDPQPGDVAISTAGYWGHAMYVEAAQGNQIYVSEYNNFLTGRFWQEWRTYR